MDINDAVNIMTDDRDLRNVQALAEHLEIPMEAATEICSQIAEVAARDITTAMMAEVGGNDPGDHDLSQPKIIAAMMVTAFFTGAHLGHIMANGE